MSETYRIEYNHASEGWTSEGLGMAEGWLTVAAARRAVEGLGTHYGDEWRGSYRIVAEDSGEVVESLEVQS